jgi:hypothetical protein
VPAERTELDGPFYNPFFDTFGKSPFEPADFGLQGNTTFPRDDDTPGGSAGQFATVWQTPGTVEGDAWSDYLEGSKDIIAD